MLMQARGLFKSFGSVRALDHVDLDLRPGEIHAVLGENGAGKSTLMHLLSGLLAPDTGGLLLDNAPVRFHSPREAAARGIGMVYQHFMLIPNLTVAENLALAFGSGPLFDPGRAANQAQRVAADLGWTIEPEARIEDLPVGTRQRVELMKALQRGGHVLILDEPTAVLSPQEVDELFSALRRLRAQGRTIAFISHKLEEALRISDRITVLRHGRVVGERRPARTTADELAQLIVGAATSPIETERSGPRDDEAILSVEQLSTHADDSRIRLGNITFSIARGEVLGVAGVDGNGQVELAECIVGLRSASRGQLTLRGQPLHRGRHCAGARGRIAYIPQDRHLDGLVLDAAVWENLLLEQHAMQPFRRAFFLDQARALQWSQALVSQFDIRAGVGDIARKLSGGNQQKVVVARALAGEPELVVAVNPTRGLDVSATQYVRQQLLKQQQRGAGILLISTDLDEVLALSNRIAVMDEGRIVGIVSADMPRETIGMMMGGAAAHAAPLHPETGG